MPDTTNPGTPEDVLPGGARPRRSHEAGGQRRESTIDMELATPPVERGPVAAAVVLTVNGEEHEVRLEPRVSLLDAAQPARRGNLTRHRTAA